MLKRILSPVLLGLAIGSHAVMAADTDSTSADRDQKSAEQQSDQWSDQKKIDEYWRMHDGQDQIYNFNP